MGSMDGVDKSCDGTASEETDTDDEGEEQDISIDDGTEEHEMVTDDEEEESAMSSGDEVEACTPRRVKNQRKHASLAEDTERAKIHDNERRLLFEMEDVKNLHNPAERRLYLGMTTLRKAEQQRFKSIIDIEPQLSRPLRWQHLKSVY